MLFNPKICLGNVLVGITLSQSTGPEHHVATYLNLGRSDDRFSTKTCSCGSQLELKQGNGLVTHGLLHMLPKTISNNVFQGVRPVRQTR